jgi:glucose-1-phosphate adenylyltransferase
MSVNYNVLGLIFASLHDKNVSELTDQRTMGSIPFGGRYRLIDFPLSNMVNSNIAEVGVITKANYGSLLDHLGSGRDWDLSRKKGGLHLLPPFIHSSGDIYKGRLDALNKVWNFVSHSPAKYVIMANCDVITSIDYNPVLKQHIESGADITMVYSEGFYDYSKNRGATVVDFDENNCLTDVLFDPLLSGKCKLWLESFIIDKEFLWNIILDAKSRGEVSFTRYILQENRKKYKIMGYEHKEFFTRIDNIGNYYKANMMLLESDKRNGLFRENMPIYTKIGDNGPVKYGVKSSVKNSLIADGCIIEGTVENSILFRGVKVGKDSVVRDCVLLQGTTIGSGCGVTAVITDKNATVTDGRVITGSPTYPIYIDKNGKL